MKEIKINILENCKIDKIENINDVLTITLKEKERKLPKSWEEFCEMFPNIVNEFYISNRSTIETYTPRAAGSDHVRHKNLDAHLLPDFKTAVAMLALCKLIQLRNAYNGDWVPDWKDQSAKFIIFLDCNGNVNTTSSSTLADILFFKNENLCDEFLRNFGDLIEKLKPLYGIKEGGEE